MMYRMKRAVLFWIRVKTMHAANWFNSVSAACYYRAITMKK